MTISLCEVRETESMILQNFYSLYLHDLSKFTTNLDIGPEGAFEFDELDMFWKTDGLTPYFIKMNDEIIGFLLLLERPFLSKENDFGINDLFILNKFKGKGYGQQAVAKLFQMKRGKYFVMELVENTPAVSFWKKVFKELSIEYEEKTELVDDESCFIQTFKV